jgi:DNA-binding transcriptional LysR family regulator
MTWVGWQLGMGHGLLSLVIPVRTNFIYIASSLSTKRNQSEAPKKAPMDTLTNLRTFLTVTRVSGFSEASRQLNVVPSVVAKRIAQLEQTMKARLFERSTRVVELTEAGRRLQTRAAALVSELDNVIADVQPDEGGLAGHIRIMAPTTFGMVRLAPLLDAFLGMHERVSLEVTLADRSTNPIEAGFDLAISGRLASYEGVVDVPLCPVQPKLCAAPDYPARHRMPEHPRELASHDCLVFRPLGGLWAFQTPRGLIHVEARGRLVAEDNHTLLVACLNGRGIALLPGYVSQSFLADRRLVEVLPGYPLQDAWFKAFVPRRSHRQTKIQALLAHLIDGLQGDSMRLQ